MGTDVTTLLPLGVVLFLGARHRADAARLAPLRRGARRDHGDRVRSPFSTPPCPGCLARSGRRRCWCSSCRSRSTASVQARSSPSAPRPCRPFFSGACSARAVRAHGPQRTIRPTIRPASGDRPAAARRAVNVTTLVPAVSQPPCRAHAACAASTATVGSPGKRAADGAHRQDVGALCCRRIDQALRAVAHRERCDQRAPDDIGGGRRGTGTGQQRPCCRKRDGRHRCIDAEGPRLAPEAQAEGGVCCLRRAERPDGAGTVTVKAGGQAMRDPIRSNACVRGEGRVAGTEATVMPGGGPGKREHHRRCADQKQRAQPCEGAWRPRSSRAPSPRPHAAASAFARANAPRLNGLCGFCASRWSASARARPRSPARIAASSAVR